MSTSTTGGIAFGCGLTEVAMAFDRHLAGVLLFEADLAAVSQDNVQAGRFRRCRSRERTHCVNKQATEGSFVSWGA